MFKIDRQAKTLVALLRPGMAPANILERQDLQEYIWNSFEDFASEIDAEGLTVIGKEVRPSKVVDDRIDLLAVDRDGTAVVIELKRAKHKLQLLQAAAYAAMISKLKKAEIGDLSGVEKDHLSALELDDEGAFNDSQGILLIAEDFDFQVLATAEWLYKQGISMKCVRVTLETEDNGAEYLNFSVVFPPKELAAEAKRRKPLPSGVPASRNWAEYSQRIGPSSQVKEFLEKHLAEGVEENIKYKALFFRIGGARRFEAWLKWA